MTATARERGGATTDSVAALGYLGIASARLSAWRQFAEEVLGLQATSVDGALQLRLDDRAWRIQVGAGPADDLDCIGFEVANAEALARVERRLRDRRLEVRRSEELAVARGVAELVRTRDPDGLDLELFHGASDQSDRAFVSPTGGEGFVTGEAGLGHVALAVESLDRARDFYEQVLGMKLSDVIEMPATAGLSTSVVFMHCNRRHHSVAIAEMPGEKRLHHFMLQMRSLSDVGLALDRAVALDYEICRTLGQHTNDRTTSFYVRSPSGFEVELGWGGIEVGPEWSAKRYTRGSIWGHAVYARA